MKGGLFAVYSGLSGSTYHAVRPDAKFVHHNDSSSSMLRGFDPNRHGLFALDNSEILLYELGNEAVFFKQLLTSSTAFALDPFYRLSLALDTDERSIIRPLYTTCLKRLKRHAPEFIDQWVDAMAAISSICAGLRREALARPSGTLPSTRVVSYALANKASPVSDGIQQYTDIPPTITSEAITSAVRDIVRSNREVGRGKDSPYYIALLASLGASRPRAIVDRMDLPPNALEVARQSGLSLPYLEFLNLILSKTTALRFLELSGVNIHSEFFAGDLFRSKSYERKFGRRATKVKHRLLFTFAEVAVLVGYAGQLVPPIRG